MPQIVDIADLDCIYLTYDEPKKEEFWIKIQNMVPWAKRVDGVKGSDAAHKAAADASDTDRFVLIDGDNIPDPEFFNQQLKLDKDNQDCVFRWKARNHINGLMYGNGGLSCWTKDFVYNMKTHENSDGSEANDVEFCFYPNYWAMHDCYSTTYPNASAFQAWRAGFREGVKMCLNRGKKPGLVEFEKNVHQRNYDHLCVWQSVGADVENGSWAMYGARLGTFLTLLSEWEHTNVMWFDNFPEMWEESKSFDPKAQANRIGETLKDKLGLPMCMLDPEQSKFFKRHYNADKYNLGPLVKEMDVIRKIEGW
jgi:hypothetical protein